MNSQHEGPSREELFRELQAIDRALDPTIPGDGTTGATRSDGSPRQHISTVGRVRLLLQRYGDLKRSIAEPPKEEPTVKLSELVTELKETAPPSDAAPRITMTKSYLSGRQCCDFTIADDDSETHEQGCPWRLVDEFAASVDRCFTQVSSISWLFDRIAKLQEDMASSPIRRVEDAP